MITEGGLPPSLLSDESRGGDTNEGGLDFQMAVLMAQLPRWLAMDGFTMLIREASGDFEAQFFVPGRGYLREFFESKDHQVTPAEFWAEIDQFKKFDYDKDREFQWFTLVSAGLSEGIRPVMNGLRRVRDPYGFYDAGSPVFAASYQAYVEVVEKLGRTAEDAAFLFTKVKVDPDWASARVRGAGNFKDAVGTELPQFANLPNRVLDEIYAGLGELVKAARNTPVKRRDLEERLRGLLLPAQPTVAPVRMHTTTTGEPPAALRELIFSWERFFGGPERIYPPPAQWNEGLVRELHETKQWMLAHRVTRRVRLSGERRLSSSPAFGFVFSAVAGFAVEMVGRDGSVWATDDHACATTPPYQVKEEGSFRQQTGRDLVVGISFVRDISAEVMEAVSGFGLPCAPTLFLSGEAAVISAKQTNAIVMDLKKRVARALQTTHAQTIHLFFAGPAFVALLLGHRLNATAAVQCYEWTGHDRYVPTCLLS